MMRKDFSFLKEGPVYLIPVLCPIPGGKGWMCQGYEITWIRSGKPYRLRGLVSFFLRVITDSEEGGESWEIIFFYHRSRAVCRYSRQRYGSIKSCNSSGESVSLHPGITVSTDPRCRSMRSQGNSLHSPQCGIDRFRTHARISQAPPIRCGFSLSGFRHPSHRIASAGTSNPYIFCQV